MIKILEDRLAYQKLIYLENQHLIKERDDLNRRLNMVYAKLAKLSTFGVFVGTDVVNIRTVLIAHDWHHNGRVGFIPR